MILMILRSEFLSILRNPAAEKVCGYSRYVAKKLSSLYVSLSERNKRLSLRQFETNFLASSTALWQQNSTVLVVYWKQNNLMYLNQGKSENTNFIVCAENWKNQFSFRKFGSRLFNKYSLFLDLYVIFQSDFFRRITKNLDIQGQSSTSTWTSTLGSWGEKPSPFFSIRLKSEDINV